MTKKERVLAAIHRDAVDYAPTGFSLHFDPALHGTPAEITAHLKFFEEADTDIQKIMNENLVPDFGPVSAPEDWKALGSFSRNSKFIQDQLEFTQRLLEKANPDAYSLGTLHGIVASSIHPIERRYGYVPVRKLLCEHLRCGKPYLYDAMSRIAEALCFLAQGYAEAGVDGIYFASLGGEARYFTDAEFDEYVAPLDIQIMRAGREAGLNIFLHACKDGLVMERYQRYAPFSDVVNWGVYENPSYPLERGRTLFQGVTLMGGISNLKGGPLHCGTPEQIANEVRSVLNTMGTQGFILGADCTLPSDTPYQNIRNAVKAVQLCSQNR